MSKDNIVKIRAREEELTEQWQEETSRMPVNNQQHSFDSVQRQQNYINAQFQTKEELEKYNWYRSEWYRRPKEYDPGNAPLAVCCELVSSCNLQCPMCYTITEEFQSSVVGVQRMLPWEIVTKIIDECVELGVPSMLFSWRGESSIYKSVDENGNQVNFADVLAYARKKGILEITCLTNGQLLTEELAKQLVDADPSWINFSIDGLEKNYNMIRAPKAKASSDYNAFNKVIENIKRIVEYRDAKGKKRPQLRTNTIYPPIAEDPMAYHDFMENLGVGWITVNELLDFRGESLPDDAIIEDWACQYPYQRLTISANGTILPCTGAHNEEKELSLGRYPGSRVKQVKIDGKDEFIDLPERTLKEVWHCSEMNEIRNIHKENKRKNIFACKHCRHGAVKHGVEWVPEDWDMDTMEWRDGLWRE